MTSQNERLVVEKIKNKYSPKEKGASKFDELKSLDNKVRMPALIFAYVFGVLGTLVLGLGMSFALGALGNSMIAGIIVGIVGILMVCINYPIFKTIITKRKSKYSELIIEKSNELLND